MAKNNREQEPQRGSASVRARVGGGCRASDGLGGDTEWDRQRRARDVRGRGVKVRRGEGVLPSLRNREGVPPSLRDREGERSSEKDKDAQ